jgi:hypothetical protein
MEIVFLVWIGLAFVAASVARSKGLSGFGYFVLSCLMSFVVAIIVLAIVPSRKTLVATKEAAQCPFCREEVKFEAIVCKHCGRDIQPLLIATTKPYFEGSAGQPSLSVSGRVGVGLILIGSFAILYWLYGTQTWSSSEERDVPVWGRIVTLLVEIAILVWGFILHSRAVKRTNKRPTE